MDSKKIKYIKYFFVIIVLYTIFIIVLRLINIYTLFVLLIILFTLYKTDKILFKKLVFKIIYKDRKRRLLFKDKFGAAKISLDSITEINNKINDKVKFDLLNYEKSLLQYQLKSGDYNVTLFGSGSSGKTSIARSLLKSIIGKTSPTIGTTKEIISYKVRIPILKRNINIIDTPGLFEPSELGQKREEKTILQASNSDLVIFVLDQDINKFEKYLIEKLLKIGKKLIIVLNKCDLRSTEENNIIQQNIRLMTDASNNNISVVNTIAAPKYQPNSVNYAIKRIPEVNILFREIIQTLDNNGEELLAENILYRSNKLGIKSKQLITEQRSLMANKAINKYMWITGGVILVNPLPGVDFLAATSVNIQMIMEISKIYEVRLLK